MGLEIELEGKLYRYINKQWYDASFIKPPLVICQRLDALVHPPQIEPKSKSYAYSSEDQASEIHEKIYPFIAESIRSRYARTNDFVPHDVIVDDLLNNRESRGIVLSYAEKHNKRSLEVYAGNLVAWFGAFITGGKKGYADLFESRRIGNNSLDYRPIS